MARIKGALATRKRRNKTLKLAKGYWGGKSRLFKTAKEAVALTYGPAIANANKVEAQIDAALAEVNAMLEAVESGIVIAAPTEVEDAADIDVSVEVEVG